MHVLRKKLARVFIIRLVYYKYKNIIFDLKCIFHDVCNLSLIYKKSKDVNVVNSDVVFVCSLPFYTEKKWQVVSQSDLWHGFVKENNCLICGSFVSYWLFGRHKKYAVSLEPKYNAPIIKFSKLHEKTFTFISDSHSKAWLPKYIKNKNITDILTPYKKTLLYTGFYKPLNEARVHSLPWCVADRLLDNVKIQLRSSNILGFGQAGSVVYDLRTWAFETGVLTSFNYAGSGNKKFSGDAYYEWLSTFDACVVAMSTQKLFSYTVAKFFEVPSQGLLLFGFKTEDLEDFGFIDGENYISVSKLNFFNKINKYKSNPEKYLQIRKNGFELIKNHHTVSKRIEQLNIFLKS